MGVVISGATRLLDEAVAFDVDGSSPAITDMPTPWAHKITHTGDGELTTIFWTNVLFNPQHTDTYPEDVR